ncbi:MAG TPA: histidine kinase [Oxalobacteraceae bacterium]|nr:histidine kinase [Oxalobacteraceae bacterium]
MKLRQKITLFAITPLFLALGAIAFAVHHQAVLLAEQQRAAVEHAYLASKQTELKHYVALGMRSIAGLYDSGRNDDETLNRAKSILSKMEWGDDGYFYIYNLAGVNLMHPRQSELVGRNLWDLRDSKGNPTIQKLIARARAGGGLERYLWEKPSLHKEVPKLGYVVMLPRWGWMLGTGIYLDDVDAALSKLDAQNSANILNTMLWIAGIATMGVLFITFAGLALNISESRVSDAKLRALAQRVVSSQEDERARLSRDLHDGISQGIFSIRLQVESGIAKLADPACMRAAHVAFERAAAQLNEILGEVRRISHDLRPAILDDLGLAVALDHLAKEFSDDSSMQVKFETSGSTDGLSAMAITVLFRIAQESLTNIKRHAEASLVTMRLAGSKRHVELAIDDNGGGFDVQHITLHPRRGIGLRNMYERVEAIGGQIRLRSTIGQGTQVHAILPRG